MYGIKMCDPCKSNPQINLVGDMIKPTVDTIWWINFEG